MYIVSAAIWFVPPIITNIIAIHENVNWIYYTIAVRIKSPVISVSIFHPQLQLTLP